MNVNRTKKWILSAAIALGAAGFSTGGAVAAPRDRDENTRMADLPRDVRESIDRERGSRDIKALQHVVRNGDEFYRVTLDDRGGKNRVYRFSPGGKLLGEDTVTDRDIRESVVNGSDERQIKLANAPRDVRETIDRERGNRDVKAVYEVRRGNQTFYRAIIDERNGDKMIRVGDSGKLLSDQDVREVRTAGAVIRRGVDDDGDRVNFDRLPGEVKTAIAREAGSDRVGDVYRYDRRGGSVYEAEVNTGSRTRVIRVNENGRVVAESDGTAEGRRTVSFNDLPGAVKSAIASKVNENQVARVVQVTRGGDTYYRARVEERGRDPYWITVDDRGRETRDFDRAR
jgi:hypothetical protein